MAKIILFSGSAESGKTFSLNILKEKLESYDKKVMVLNFADCLKFVAREYFKWDGKKDDAGREILQKLGTDIIRRRNPRFWSGFVVNLVDVFYPDYDYFLIGDWRFPDEFYCFGYLEFGSVITIRIIRKNFNNSLTDEQKKHISEIALDDFDFDYILESESGIENLSREVEKLFLYIMGS